MSARSCDPQAATGGSGQDAKRSPGCAALDGRMPLQSPRCTSSMWVRPRTERADRLSGCSRRRSRLAIGIRTLPARMLETEAARYRRSPLAHLLPLTCVRICWRFHCSRRWEGTSGRPGPTPNRRDSTRTYRSQGCKVSPVIAVAGNRSIHNIADQLDIRFCRISDIVASQLGALLRMNRTGEDQCMEKRQTDKSFSRPYHQPPPPRTPRDCAEPDRTLTVAMTGRSPSKHREQRLDHPTKLCGIIA